MDLEEKILGIFCWEQLEASLDKVGATYIFYMIYIYNLQQELLSYFSRFSADTCFSLHLAFDVIQPSLFIPQSYDLQIGNIFNFLSLKVLL